MRVLCLEDNQFDADLAMRALARASGVERVDVVGSLAEAWRRLESADERPDAALVDIDLPDGSGLEFVIGVRARDFPLALVVLTGNGDERSAVAALKAGADDYLVKRDDYLAELPQVLESARAAFGAGRARRTRSLRVLYAEHNVADVDLARRHLARHAPHIQLKAVSDGPGVLEALAGPNEGVDVVLLDYRLRGLDAIELIGVMRARGLLRAPVVLVTGQGDEAAVVRALREGASDYLVKRPGYLHELAATLENAHHRTLLWREQQALRDSEDRFRQLAEHIDEVFWLADPREGRVLYASPAFVKIWGRPCADATRDRELWSHAASIEDREMAAAWMAAVLRGEEPAPIEHRVERPDGSVRWVRRRATVVRDACGVVGRVVGVDEDVTERRQLEEQFRQSQKMEAIGRLSGGVAHDFNNLLTIIQGHLDLLRETGRAAPEAEGSLTEIARATESASNLVRQLLAFSRKQPLRPQDLDLRDVVRDVDRMLRRIVGEDVVIKLDLGSEPAWARVDASMIEQVLMNLSVNARDAMPRGGVLEITLAELPKTEVPAGCLSMDAGPLADAYVRLSVSDQGTGIPPELLERIFEPFFTTKPVGQGTGLGLAMVYGIARQHGGGVAVRSSLGEGSRFDIFLPRTGAPETPPAAVDQTVKPVSATTQQTAGATILLVEDEEAVSDLIGLALGWSGHRLHVASNAAGALELWGRHQADIDLVITDVVMPGGMSGCELVDRLRVDRPRLPVIVMSGYNPETSEHDFGRVAQPARFLTKPFALEELGRQVRAMLSERDPVEGPAV